MTLTISCVKPVRMTARDWRAGELRLLAMALVIAVAAVTSVGFFVDRFVSDSSATPRSCSGPISC